MSSLFCDQYDHMWVSTTIKWPDRHTISTNCLQVAGRSGKQLLRTEPRFFPPALSFQITLPKKKQTREIKSFRKITILSKTSGWEDFGRRFLMPAEEEPNEGQISWCTEVHIVCLFTGCLMFCYWVHQRISSPQPANVAHFLQKIHNSQHSTTGGEKKTFNVMHEMKKWNVLNQFVKKSTHLFQVKIEDLPPRAFAGPTIPLVVS